MKNIPKNFIDLTGRKFGKLTVIRRSYPDGKGWRVKWLCKCKCGRKSIVSGCNLVNGHTKSCGCLQKLPSGVANMNVLMASYKYEAKRRGYEWELTKGQFKEITQRNCYYCGAVPNQSCLSKNPICNGDYIYNGIDRVDNKKGYAIENVVPCCGVCNMAKGKLTQKEFLNWIKKVYKYQYKTMDICKKDN